MERREEDLGGGNRSVYETYTNYASDCQTLDRLGVPIKGYRQPSESFFVYDEDRRLIERYGGNGEYEYTYLNCD